MIADKIKGELARITTPKKLGSKFSFILCPYHSEKTPSGRVYHDDSGFSSKAYFKCYGCGVRKSWAQLASDLGLNPFTGDGEFSPSGRVLKHSFETVDSDLLGNAPLEATLDDLTLYKLTPSNAERVGIENYTWRGFDCEFLRKFVNARISYWDRTGRYYMFLPVNLFGEQKGFIQAQLKKPTDKKIPSYLNAGGAWSLHFGLFPFDPAIQLMRSKDLSTLVLVEGPRDALRLLSKGIPAVSILGTQSWSDSKSSNLEFAGVEKIIIFMDGDAAGKAATRMLETGKRQEGIVSFKPLSSTFQVETLRLWKVPLPENFPESSLDPGNCPDFLLTQLHSKLV